MTSTYVPEYWRESDILSSIRANRQELDAHVIACSECAAARGNTYKYCEYGYDIAKWIAACRNRYHELDSARARANHQAELW